MNKVQRTPTFQTNFSGAPLTDSEGVYAIRADGFVIATVDTMEEAHARIQASIPPLVEAGGLCTVAMYDRLGRSVYIQTFYPED